MWPTHLIDNTVLDWKVYCFFFVDSLVVLGNEWPECWLYVRKPSFFLYIRGIKLALKRLVIQYQRPTCAFLLIAFPLTPCTLTKSVWPSYWSNKSFYFVVVLLWKAVQCSCCFLITVRSFSNYIISCYATCLCT